MRKKGQASIREWGGAVCPVREEAQAGKKQQPTFDAAEEPRR